MAEKGRTWGQDIMRGEWSAANGARRMERGNHSGCLHPASSGHDFGEEYTGGDAWGGEGTSIFDPVLCELVYTWFCPPGGLVLDPFAGGSVRGIVAAKLGRGYVGVDLRPEQVAANEHQWAEVARAGDGVASVKVSAASARLRFHGCDPDYIRTTCHASCCRSSQRQGGCLVTVHPSEQAAIEQLGGVVEGGLLQPRDGEHGCPFQDADGLCSLHDTEAKPFGCIASPFTLNTNGTLIVRNRYKSLKCYQKNQGMPAYRAFRASIDLIFGENEAQRIIDHLEAGGGDMMATPLPGAASVLLENDRIKHGANVTVTAPRWVVGDSANISALAPGEYDLVFSCPPYGDLEKYSEDPADLSNLDWAEFLVAYRNIVAQAVGLLKPDRFAVFVVGEFRDKQGNYRGLVPETVRAFEDAGAHLYNEAILVTAVGSLPIRVGKAFCSSRKLGKTHQNVLVFVKGSGKKAAQACGEVEVYEQDQTQDVGA